MADELKDDSNDEIPPPLSVSENVLDPELAKQESVFLNKEIVEIARLIHARSNPGPEDSIEEEIQPGVNVHNSNGGVSINSSVDAQGGLGLGGVYLGFNLGMEGPGQHWLIVRSFGERSAMPEAEALVEEHPEYKEHLETTYQFHADGTYNKEVTIPDDERFLIDPSWEKVGWVRNYRKDFEEDTDASKFVYTKYSVPMTPDDFEHAGHLLASLKSRLMAKINP